MKNRPATLTGQMVGRTPWSARDALVPLPGQRYQHHAERQQADGGVGRGPGGPPHHSLRVVFRPCHPSQKDGWLTDDKKTIVCPPGVCLSEQYWGRPYLSSAFKP